MASRRINQRGRKHGYLPVFSVLLLITTQGCTELGADRLPAGILLEQVERAAPQDRVQYRGIYPPGLDLTKRSEGFIAKPYNDAVRYCTIAYGHLIKLRPCDGTEPENWRRGIAEPDGATLLVKDMRLAEAAVLTATSSSITLTDGQYAALCDFVFNVGSKNYLSSTLRTRVNSGDFRDVPRQFRRWTQASGKVLPGLVTRREREIALFTGTPEGQERAGAVPRPSELIDIRVGERG